MLNRFNKYIYIILGGLLLCWYLWVRFIRKRLPRDIPFDLSLISTIILCFICIIYMYVILVHLGKIKPKSDSIVQLLIYQPLIKVLVAFDMFIRSLPYIEYWIEFIVVNMAHVFSKLYSKELDHFFKPFYFIMIFPQILIISVLYTDIFYFHQLFYFYRIIPICLFILLFNYLLFSCSLLSAKYYSFLSEHLSSIALPYFPGVHPSELNQSYTDILRSFEEEDEEDIDPPTADDSMNLPLNTAIAFLAKIKVFPSINWWYMWTYIHPNDLEDFGYKNNFFRHNMSDDLQINLIFVIFKNPGDAIQLNKLYGSQTKPLTFETAIILPKLNKLILLEL